MQVYTINYINWSFLVKFNVIIIHVLHYVILLGIYSSYIFSQHVKTPRLRLSGFPELINDLENNRRFFVSSSGKDWFFETVRDSNTYPYKAIRQALQNNPVVITKSKLDTINVVSKYEGMAVVMQDDETNGMAKKFCNLVKMKEPVSMGFRLAR